MPAADPSSTRAHHLPEPLPADPLPLFQDWFDHAQRLRPTPNPNAMSVATVGPDGAPSARILLCKRIEPAAGFIVFYTNYRSAKANALDANPRAAAVFHWDALDRQVRLEGPVTRSPEDESDSYFASRPLDSRVGAWASDQSQPLASRAAFQQRIRDAATLLGLKGARVDDDGLHPSPDSPVIRVPRPPNWGGYRLWVARIELWVSGPGRLHDRAVWTRRLAPATIDGVPGFIADPKFPGWSGTRLMP